MSAKAVATVFSKPVDKRGQCDGLEYEDRRSAFFWLENRVLISRVVDVYLPQPVASPGNSYLSLHPYPQEPPKAF